MPDSAQEKTEPATPRRREEARNRGQVGKSTDLTAAVSILAGLVVLQVMGQDMLGRLLNMTRSCLGGSGPEMTQSGYMVQSMAGVFHELVGVVLPLMLVVVVVALGACFVQVGPLFTFTPLTPSLDKLNPLNGLKRMFSGRSFVQLAQGIAKIGLLALVCYWTISGRIDVFAHASGLHHLSMIAVAAELLFTLGLRLAIVLLILGIIDFTYQRYKTEQDMRMTQQEVREELKRMEGDPMLKRRRREVQMQLSMQRIQAAVPQADVVITNPTELAVAVQYDSETMNAPKVTAKGAELLAQRIRDLAIEHGVPIVERKPLAQILYKNVEVGQEIPAKFYKAVAEILAYVYELAGKSYGHRSPAAVALN